MINDKKLMAKSFRTKLWIWFAVFAAIILSLLWILQTVFLQRFYNSMMVGNIRSAAEEIIKNSENEDLDDLIDELSVEDSLLVYITDDDGDVLDSSDAYNTYFRQLPRQEMSRNRNDPRRKQDEKGGYSNMWGDSNSESVVQVLVQLL